MWIKLRGTVPLGIQNPIEGCRGRQVEWIGAVLQPWLSATLVPGLTLTITREKIAKLAGQCDEILNAQSPIDRGQVQRHCREPTAYFTLITFDAALTGGGAMLQAGLKSLEDAATQPIVAYWHTRWNDDDYKLLKVSKGSRAAKQRSRPTHC